MTKRKLLILLIILVLLLVDESASLVPIVTFENFHVGVCVHRHIRNLHKIKPAILYEFATRATECVSGDSCALSAMNWINHILQRQNKRDKTNPIWHDVLGSAFGYSLLHQAYHMFDYIEQPVPPFKCMKRKLTSAAKKHMIKGFDSMYDTYLEQMHMYTASKTIVVELRALMNIIHFGSFVDEGVKAYKHDRVLHRSALLESINEAQRKPKLKLALISEYERCNNRITYYSIEPNWR